MTPVSTFMTREPRCAVRRSCHTPAVSSFMTAEAHGRASDPGEASARAAGTDVAVAELDEHVHELPARVPVLLHRAAARAAVGAREQGHARAPRAAAPHVAAARRAHDRQRRSPTSPGPRPRSRPTPSSRDLELTDEEWADVPRRRRGARAPLLRDRRPARDHGARRRAARHRGDRRRRDRSAASSTGSSSTPTASSSSPTTRPARAPSEGWEQKSLAGVHIYSLLCERMFGRRPTRVQLLYLSKPERIITAADRPVAARRRGEVGRGDEGGAHGVRARRLPAPHVGAVRVLLVPGVLPRVRRRSRRRPRR